MRALSPRDRAVLDFTCEYIEEAGYPPTRNEIAKACGIGSTATVNRIIWGLVNRGYLIVPGPNKGIQIVESA